MLEGRAQAFCILFLTTLKVLALLCQTMQVYLHQNINLAFHKQTDVNQRNCRGEAKMNVFYIHIFIQNLKNYTCSMFLTLVHTTLFSVKSQATYLHSSSSWESSFLELDVSKKNEKEIKLKKSYIKMEIKELTEAKQKYLCSKI